MDVFVTLTINVDYDPSETAWQVKDDLNDAIIDSRGLGSYLLRCREYGHRIKLTYDRPYTFTILDAFGDGMSKICNANYTMSLTDTKEDLFFGDGLSFTFAREHTFTIDQPAPFPPATKSPSIYKPIVTHNPSQAPSLTPSLRPSQHPTTPPSSSAATAASCSTPWCYFQQGEEVAGEDSGRCQSCQKGGLRDLLGELAVFP